MGCFNMKCALTHLPITPHDKVVMLFGVRPSKSEKHRDDCGGFFYQTHWFKLITTPIYGTYNDYGWVEDIDEESMDNAVKFLEACGYTESAEALRGDHWHDSLQAIGDEINGWADSDERLRATVYEKTEYVDIDYTFVHRSVWDNLIEQGRKIKEHSSFSFTFPKDCDLNADKKKLTEYLESFGFDGIKFDKYGHQENHWVNYNGTYDQRFNLAMDVLSNPVEFKEPTLEEMIAELGGDLGFDDPVKIRSFYKLMMERDGREKNPLLEQAKYSFEWLRPMFDQENRGFNSRKKFDKEVSKKIIELANSIPSIRKTLADLNLMFRSLMDNQLVIRAQRDLPTQSQESTYWGHVIINRAVTEILKGASDRYAEYGEDEDVDSSEDPLDQLIQREMDRSY